MALIGEQLSESMGEDDEICGASIKIRGQNTDTIQIWNVNSEKHLDARVSFGAKFYRLHGVGVSVDHQLGVQ